MTPTGHRLLAQVGAGPDGVAYRALAPDGSTPVEVRVLQAASANPERWEALTRRLRLAALLRHPAAIAVRSLHLEEKTPCAVVEWVEGEPLSRRAGDAPLPRDEALDLAQGLAEVLTAAHRLGLVHGALRPEAILVTGSPRLALDFTATDVGGAASPARADAADPAADSAGLGAVLHWALTGEDVRHAQGAFADPPPLPGPLGVLLADLLAADPAARIPVREAADRLLALRQPMQVTQVLAPEGGAGALGTTTAGLPPTPAVEEPLRERLGRFRLLEKLGQGGMGTVYRAEDVSDGRTVAVKVLRQDWAARPDAVRRFHKEARLLAEINNPYVANLLEVNEDDGVHYLALEFVAGRSAESLLQEHGQLDESEALAVMADVARALVEAHARGVVHRDVKPENIVVQETADAAPRVKLLDFGLARHVVESDSLNVTQAGTILGTLLYMAPEQCAGGALDARADVYSMGATLYHLLAGRPPFVAESPLALIAQHTREAPPPLGKLNPSVSEGACRVVEKALAKAPADRYPDAAALLEDLERLRRGEPSGLVVHPRRPECDPRRVLRYEFSWDLEAPPRELWPHVSNTERLNRALGMTPVQFSAQTEESDGGRRVRRSGEFRKAGLSVKWEEHPFEWVEARRMGVLREYSQGPFKWLMSMLELTPRGEGTRLTHRVELEPAGVLGRTLAAVEVGVRGRRGLERVYRRIDAAVTGKATSPRGRALVDPFEEPAELTRPQRRRLEAILDDLAARGVPPEVAEPLADYVAHAPDQAVARIRPLALAERLGLDTDAVVSACLHAARAGLLVLLWDILCPLCRIPAGVKETLRLLEGHDHCPACDLDFALDFANSVELIFRAHPEVRASELGTYCIGGPAHSPHVVAQTRVGPGERVELDLALDEGAYRLRGPQLPFTLDFRVRPGATAWRWDLGLAHAPPELPRQLRPGGQLFALNNDGAVELVVRVERTAARGDALTAARASSLALFRELFPDEVLSPGRLVSVATVALLVTDLDGAGALYRDLGDAPAFALIHEHFCLLRDVVRSEGGALVKTVGEGIVAAFNDSLPAVRAALEMPGALAANEATRGLRLRAGVHRGPAQAATLNDQLDYFGSTVRQAAALPALARPGEVVLTPAAAGDPAVAALLRERGLSGMLFEADLPGETGCVLQRVSLLGESVCSR
jgi:serine/threonine protein kinase/class 3 adenylate cyclase